MNKSLTLRQARRIALAAQGFARPRPAPVTPRHLESTLRRIAPLQLDFVNVLVPAHYLIPFSRLGAYPRESLHSLLYEQGKFTEQWAHEAAAIPVETWPLLKHRMEQHIPRPRGFEALLRRHRKYAESVMESIRTRGPLAAHELPEPPPSVRDFSCTWIGTFQRAVLETYFGRGILASANRLPNFVRAYDLAERRIPAPHHSHAPSRDEAICALIEKAAQAHGVGTAHDLADYYRLNIVEAKQAIATLVASGALEQVSVETWREPAFLHPQAIEPRKTPANALLSPFDPLVWFRPRASRLFHFDYRIEIYTPQAKRRFGYYVLPFLQGENITSRVDLKANRPAGTLQVLAAWHEDSGDPHAIAAPLQTELEALARWLGLSRIDIAAKGNLAAFLR